MTAPASTDGPAPDGVQNERTALAWQRTALSLLASSLILARLTFGRLGVVSLVPVVAAVAVTAWIFFESRGRYRHDAGIALRPRSRGGTAPFALALLTVLLALTELVAIARGTF